MLSFIDAAAYAAADDAGTLPLPFMLRFFARLYFDACIDTRHMPPFGARTFIRVAAPLPFDI